MTYVSLYRKYRPQTFEEVVGQDHVTRTLINALVEDRLHHAYLFTGPRGTGKTSTARILAKSVNCENGPTPTPCNTCSQCVDITSGSSVDVIELDMASHGGVDDARELRDRALFAPATARKKVYILDEVHMASTAAFNALLKLIEEPPSHVIFTMATTDPQKVLPTIMSRVQRLDLRRVSASDVAGHVRDLVGREGGTIDDGAVDAVVRAGDGSVRDTLSVLEQVLGFAGGDVTIDHVIDVLGHTPFERAAGIVDAAARADLADALSLIQQLVDDGHDLRRFAFDLLQHLRDLIVLQVAPDRPDLVDATDDRRARLSQQATQVDRALLVEAVDLLANALVEMRQGPPRLPLEVVFAKLTVGRDTAPVVTPPPAPPSPTASAPPQAPAAPPPSPAPTPEPTPEPAPEPPAEAAADDSAEASEDHTIDVTDDGPEESDASEPAAAADEPVADAEPAPEPAPPDEPAREPVADAEPAPEPAAADGPTDADAAVDEDVQAPEPASFADRAEARARKTAESGGPAQVSSDRPPGPEVDYAAPPPPDNDADLAGIIEQWAAILDHVRGASARIHALFQPATPTRLRNGILTLEYGERYRSFHAANATGGDAVAALAAAVDELCGVRIRVDAVVEGDGPRRPSPPVVAGGSTAAVPPSAEPHAPPAAGGRDTVVDLAERAAARAAARATAAGATNAAAGDDDVPLPPEPTEADEEAAVREAEATAVDAVPVEDAVEDATALLTSTLGASVLTDDDL